MFIVGSLVAGRGQNLDELIIGRVIQGVGGEILVPVGTAAASHLSRVTRDPGRSASSAR